MVSSQSGLAGLHQEDQEGQMNPTATKSTTRENKRSHQQAPWWSSLPAFAKSPRRNLSKGLPVV
jgi:hypothetical protein